MNIKLKDIESSTWKATLKLGSLKQVRDDCRNHSVVWGGTEASPRRRLRESMR
jgi:hypothetical protein